ncbi:hypothetical protein RYX36_027325, partial [Vicia faba]
PLQQAQFYSLVERQIWPEKIFTLNPQGDYRYFVDDIEKRKLGVLLTPSTELNFDIIQEFYANAMSIEDVRYSYCSFVIFNEIRRIAISGHSHGNKAPMTLGFSALITGLCRKAGVDIPNVATKRISSIVNDNYVLLHCVPKLA